MSVDFSGVYGGYIGEMREGNVRSFWVPPVGVRDEWGLKGW